MKTAARRRGRCGGAIEEIKLCLLDFLAATLAAPSDGFLPLMADTFGAGPARVLHRPDPISVAGAAYVHGFLATVEDIDDAHALASGMHLSATVFPVALALAAIHQFTDKGANQLPLVIEGVTFTDGVAASATENRAA